MFAKRSEVGIFVIRIRKEDSSDTVSWSLEWSGLTVSLVSVFPSPVGFKI